GSIQKKIGFRSVPVDSVVAAIEHSKRDQRIKEIEQTARMELEPIADCVGIERLLGELGEQANLNRAQQCAGATKTEPQLHDLVRNRLLCHHRYYKSLRR